MFTDFIRALNPLLKFSDPFSPQILRFCSEAKISLFADEF